MAEKWTKALGLPMVFNSETPMVRLGNIAYSFFLECKQ